MNKFNQKGIIPVIAVIITFLIIGGTAIVIQKELKQQQTKTNNSSVTKSSAKPSAVKENKDQNQSKVELAKEPFVSEPKQAGIAEPGFSITFPSGWSEVKASGNTKVAFESPTTDQLTLETDDPKVQNVQLSVKSRISIFIAKANTAYLDAEVSTAKEVLAKEGIFLNKLEKSKLNGEDAFYFEGTQKIDGTQVAEQFRSQLKSEIATKFGQTAVTKEVQSKIDKLMSNFIIRHTGYFLYKDKYAITLSGKVLISFWDKREEQLNASFQTFKILAASEKTVSEEEALKGFPEYSKANAGSFTSKGDAALPKFGLNIPSGWMQKIAQGNSYYRLELRPANQHYESWMSVTISKSAGGTVNDLPKHAESIKDEKITKSGLEGRVVEYTEDKFSDAPKHVLTNSFLVNAYLMEISAIVLERDWGKLSDQIKNIFSSFTIDK